jgi:putative lipoprotein
VTRPLLALAALLAMAPSPTVTGVVTYRERVALAPDAYVVVKLWDVTQRTNWQLIGTQTLRRVGQPPITFAVGYAADRVHPDGDYVIEAQIHQGGELRWINPAACPILTKGFPSAVTVTVRAFTTGVPSVALSSRPPRDCQYHRR